MKWMLKISIKIILRGKFSIDIFVHKLNIWEYKNLKELSLFF